MNTDTQVIGTRWMQLDKFEPSVTWEYKKHPYWRAGTPFIDRWHYPIIPEYAQRYAQFLVGNVYEFTPRAQEVLQTRKDAPEARMFRTQVGTGWGMIFFGLRDFESAPWRDERVRKALSMLIDRGPMRAHFSNSEEYAAAGLPQDVRWHGHVKSGWTAFWLNPEKDELGAASQFWKDDVAEAKKLLAAAGHPDGIELDVAYTTTPLYGADHPERCQITMDMWNQSGLVKLKPTLMEYQPYLANIYQKRDFRGAALQPEFTYVDIDQELYNTWHAKGGRFKGFPDPRVDSLVEAQRKELDDKKRIGIIQDLQRHMAEKFYWIPWDGTSSGFTFRWPYVHNSAWPGWNEWLAADTPKRNG
jgi:ABC-type transport system substrate-binding protein